jgi:hypothetical protein
MPQEFIFNTDFYPGPCPHCNSKTFLKVPIFKIVNSHGEYVEGYGCVPVQVKSGIIFECSHCHYKYGDIVKRISL